MGVRGIKWTGTHKRCNKCGEDKPLDAFHTQRNCRGGVANICKNCKTTAYEQDRATHMARGKRWRCNNPIRVRAIHVVAQSRQRAKDKQLAFDGQLSIDYVVAQLTQITECECCSEPFDLTIGKGYKNKEHSPSLDRLDSAKGYTIDNINFICWRCNRLKSDATAQELETIAAWMRSKGDNT